MLFDSSAVCPNLPLFAYCTSGTWNAIF
uniref:Uncharacterized protein n=1 Tax=Arundo donax TaxID=35708 RepID=A0A0A8ZFV9_ARUDO